VRCGNCGHMQLEQMPADEGLTAAYEGAESGDYVEEEAGQRATAASILDRIEEYTSRGAVADLGCWVGFFLSEAHRRGWQTLGVEPSEFASRYAREELGLNVVKGNLLEVELSQNQFQAIFMGDVIEHLPAADRAVSRATELLVSGGVLALALPDAGSRIARTLGARWWSIIPTHVHYFTRDSVSTLLCRRGFEILEIRTSPKAFTIGYYLARICGYHEGLGEALVRTARRLGLAERLWAPDFRDRMLVIARTACTSA